MAMQVPTEEEILAGAIAGTEQEIFDDANDRTEDENNGDRSLEEMDDDIPGETEEGEDEPDEEEPDGETDETEEEIDAAAEEDGEEPRTPDGNIGRIPSSRLREETERRRAIESELANARAQIAAFQVSQQRQQPQQEQPAKPDIWSDPEAWAADQRAQIAQEFSARHVNASLAEAHEAHGDEFVAAYKALTSLPQGDPIARATVQRIWDAPNPGKALMRWNGEQQILRQAGGDPAAYKQNVAKELMSDPEFRRQMLAEMRGEAERGDGGRPRTSTRLPKSLNGASGGGSVRNADPELYNDSDASAFAFAMK